MIKRERILEAAARIFGDHGYRGATTRLIALEAGVSEVTLFRRFGTKDALLREALGGLKGSSSSVAGLPETPADPERELVHWCARYLRQLRAARKVIRKSLGELADRPSVASGAAALPATASRVVREYLERASRRRVLPSGFDVTAAATILTGVLFADAMSRDIMPREFPEPVRDVHRLYVRFVLRGIRNRTAPSRHSAQERSARGARPTVAEAPAKAGSTPGKRGERRASRGPTVRDPERTVFDRRRGSPAPPAYSLATHATSGRDRAKD